MICLICKYGETRPGLVSVTLERGNLTLVMKNVPAQVCENCGEEYVDEEVTAKLLDIAEDVAEAGAQVEIREYRAA